MSDDENLFEELKRYVGFGPEDEAALRGLHAIAQPAFVPIADVFYQRILQHPSARTALLGGESSVGRLKVTLVEWMETLLTGPWDGAYFERRCRIGRVHVRIALPQHYMFGAMNVIRRELNAVIDERHSCGSHELEVARAALGRILDLELAIMLHTYREDLLLREARHERLATFSQLVGSIGHELRNPLSVIETSLFILKGVLPEGDQRIEKHVQRIAQQVGVASQVVADLLDIVRDRPLKRTRVNLRGVVESAVDALVRPEGFGLETRGLDDLPLVQGDALLLRQVFLNLLENAAQAAGPKGHVAVTGERGAGVARIAVEDDGPGVDEATRRRLFEPLITTKETGIGLGLALVKRLVERHGGTVGYEPRTGGGARFIVTLPESEAP